MNAFVILPDQLFYHEKHLKTIALHDDIYIMEDPVFFTRCVYHKSKIILHRASMMRYYDYLKVEIPKIDAVRTPNIHYITCDKILKNKIVDKKIVVVDTTTQPATAPSLTSPTPTTSSTPTPTTSSAPATAPVPVKSTPLTFIDYIAQNVSKRQLCMFYPASIYLWGKHLFKTRIYGIPIKFYDTPAFLHPTEELRFARELPKLSSFYIASRKRFTPWLNPKDGDNYKPIDGEWSPDCTPKDYAEYTKNTVKPVKLPDLTNSLSQSYVNTAISYCRRFKTIGKMHRYPIDKDEAMIWLNHFMTHNLKHYADYTDISLRDSNTVFHSVISSSLNIGILTPAHVIGVVGKYWADNKTTIPYKNAECFIRNIMGMREYMRFVYIYHPDLNESNYFGHRKRMAPTWVQAKSGIPPIDDIIINVLDTGYAHNANRERIAESMFIQQIYPANINKWFLSLFIDAYDWAVYPSIEMCIWNGGGISSSKPCISTSAHISRYCELDENNIKWKAKWNHQYYTFMHLMCEKATPTDADKPNPLEKFAKLSMVINFCKMWKEKSGDERKKFLNL